MSDETKRRHKMVGWYDPGQLIATGIDVVISQVMGSRVDYRLIESFSGDQETYRYDGQQECWFDFIADLGDGWDSTYAMASLIAADQLTLGDKRLPRAQCLIMGGDEPQLVYDRPIIFPNILRIRLEMHWRVPIDDTS